MDNKAVEVSDSVLESFERFCDANSLPTLFESYGGNNVYVYSDTKAAWIAWKAAHALYSGDAKDAARWRWTRAKRGVDLHLWTDEEIDAAMQGNSND